MASRLSYGVKNEGLASTRAKYFHLLGAMGIPTQNHHSHDHTHERNDL
jgi:hypothetical protein